MNPAFQNRFVDLFSMWNMPISPFLHFQVAVVKERLKLDTHTSYPCAFKGCAEKELVPVTCPHCEKNFCLRWSLRWSHSVYLFNLYANTWTGVTLLLTDTVTSQIMNVKNWNSLSHAWLPLRNLLETLLASTKETCFIAFCIAIYLLVPKLLLLMSAFQYGRHC